MIKIVQTRKDDFQNINPKDIFSGELVTKEDTGFFSYTIMWEDATVAIVGGKLIWKGVGEVWAITSDLVYKFPLRFHKSILELISHHQDVLSLHRMQFVVKADYEHGLKWAKSLGFEKESLMKQFGQSGEDYYLFVRRWPCSL